MSQNVQTQKLEIKNLRQDAVGLGPEQAKVWVFPLTEALDASGQERLFSRLSPFIQDWQAHKVPVEGRLCLLGNKFLLISANEDVTKVSGCSTDAMFRAVMAAAEEAGTKVCDPAAIHFLSPSSEHEVQSVTRGRFKELFANGDLNPESLVFDPTISTVSQIVHGEMLKPLRTSWHSRLVKLS